MSKSLGKIAATSLERDIFEPGESSSFRLCPPENFGLFNSLKLIDFDTFYNTTVALFESTMWDHNGEITSTIKISKNDFIYSGSHQEALPDNTSIHSKKYWLTVSSYQLDTQGEFFCKALETKGCMQTTEHQETFFMALRAHNLITLDPRQKLEAEQEIKWQPRVNDYAGTPVSDFYPFYESISAHEVNPNSPLSGKNIFWYSYLIATNWRSSSVSHIPTTALQHLETVYSDDLWHFPIDNARVAVAAAHFKHAFVDLYRCLEWLYSLPRCIRLKTELGLTTKGVELAKAFRDKLAWRRAELDSLELLVIDAGPENLDLSNLNACLLHSLPPIPTLGKLSSEGHPDTIEKWSKLAASTLSKRIYSIRNQYVHQLDSLDHQEIPRCSEPALINILAQLCSILYKKYSPEF